MINHMVILQFLLVKLAHTFLGAGEEKDTISLYSLSVAFRLQCDEITGMYHKCLAGKHVLKWSYSGFWNLGGKWQFYIPVREKYSAFQRN